MLNNKHKKVTVLKPVKVKDAYKQEVTTYVSVGVESMAINYIGYANINSNDIKYNQITHTGITGSTAALKGYIIESSDTKYSVEYINSTGRHTVLYLKEIEV